MAEKSWWLEQTTRDGFTEAALKEQMRMSASKESRFVNGMTVAWGKAVQGGTK